MVGVGTSEVFEVGSSATDRAGPSAVVHALFAGGGSLIDTAPSYGEAESVVGDILAARSCDREPLSRPSWKSTGPAEKKAKRASA